MISIPICGPLRTDTFTRFLADFLSQHQIAEGHWGVVQVDLRRCSFIEAPAAAMLCGLAYVLDQRQRHIAAIPPSSPAVKRYFESCGLAHALGAGGIAAPAGELCRTSDFLLPLCRVADEHDVAAIGEFVYQSAAQQLRAPRSFASRARSVFDALCENIVVHADAGQGGWAAAQTHRREQDGARFVRLGVVDVGVGVPATMGRRYPSFSASDADTHCRAILEAMEPGVSAVESSGGIGLAQVRQLAQDCDGTLHVRSLSGQVTIGIHPTNCLRVPHFPGTQLEVILVE